MTDGAGPKIVSTDCIAWSTKASGKPEGGADSKPVFVKKGTAVVVQSVSIDVPPRSLIVRTTGEGAERTLEIRERFLSETT